MINRLFSLICLSFSLICSAQFYKNEAESKALRASEAQRYSALMDYNVNPNTLNYDLKYQRLDLKIDPGISSVSGKVTSHFLPKENLNTLFFDFTNQLHVSKVEYHGQSLSYTQLPTKELKIQFQNTLNAQVLDSLSITYQGSPNTDDGGLYFSTIQGVPLAYTLTEPYGARDWFPTKQSMNDKIERLDLVITTPNQYSVGGNGKLMHEVSVGNNQKETFWRTQYPIPAYLVAIGIANYAKHTETIGNPPFPFLNYLYLPNDANPDVRNNIEWTKDILPIFETYFGPYPYRNEKYGHMDYAAYGGAMEHATMTSMGYWGKDTIAHELLHQWFGDKITCGAWNDIWLNEGFATYGEHLAFEKLLMSPSEFLNFLYSERNYITSQPGGSVYVPEADLYNINRVFSGRLTYSKGGFVVRMLKYVLGEEAFYTALKAYLANPNFAYGYAKTPDLKSVLEQQSGKELSDFFNQWIYGQGYPSYQLKWAQNAAEVVIKINQIQSHPSVGFFKMPLPIKAVGNNGETAVLRLENTQNGQVFHAPVGFQVKQLLFNDQLEILENYSVVTYDLSVLSTEENVKAKVRVYPNPVKDVLHITGLKSTENYQILDASGRLIKEGTTKEEIFVPSLVKGHYILLLRSGQYQFIKD